MIPILFGATTTVFTTHGIGDLVDCYRCESVVNSEGEYELELDYPAEGEYINQLVINNIIYAKVNDHGNNQAFRIYSIEKTINNRVTVHAQHISYDLTCVPVKAYEATTCSAAVTGLKTNAVIASDVANYTFTTDVTTPAQNSKGKFKIEEPMSLRAALLDGDDSIKGTFGGDIVFDNYNISLLKVGGANRGMTVEYGIDMMDMALEESISEMITGVYPYWRGREEKDNEDKIIYGSVQYVSGSFEKHRVTALNVSEYFVNETKAPTVAQINQKAQEWITAEEIGKPKFNLTLSYAELGKDVRLYDQVIVRFQKIGVDVAAKVISYRYDTLKERCVEVEVGNVKPTILFDLEDASRLKRGLIPPERISNNSITEDKLGNSAIGSRSLKSDTVSDWHIKDDAITTSKIGSGAVTSAKIGSSAVTEDKIGQWAVTTNKIGDLAITSAKIENGAVDNVKIANAAVTHEKIGSGEVYNANLGDAAVTSIKIKDGEVKSVNIGSGAVISAKLGDGSVTTAKIKELAITEAKIGNSAITSAKIHDAAVGSSQIANGAVIEAKVGNAAITTQKVKDLAIDSAKIGNSAITSVKIKDGQVVKGKIGNYAVEYENVAYGEIDQLSLNAFSITSELMSEGGYAKTPDGKWVWRDKCVTEDKITDSAIGTDKIAPAAVVTAKIGDKQVAQVKLVQDVQDTLAAVWEIDALVSDYADIKKLVTDNLSAQSGVIGIVNSNSISTSNLRIGGRIVSATYIDKDSNYNDVLYLAGWY